MSVFQGNRYSFKRAEHWRAGAFDNFEVVGNELKAPLALGFVPVPGTDGNESDAIPAFDPCGHLHWLRPRTGELVRHHDFGNELVGCLVEAQYGRALIFGAQRIWVLKENAVQRYASTTQLLGGIGMSRGHRVAAIASDGGDGLWTLEFHQHGAALHCYDGFGCPCGPNVPLKDVHKHATIAASPDGRHVVVLTADTKVSGVWHLIVLSARSDAKPRTFSFKSNTLNPEPTLIAVDTINRIHVAAANHPTVLQTFSLLGERIGRREIAIPPAWEWHYAIAAADEIVVSGKTGLAFLSREKIGSGTKDKLVSTFITPTLVSPEGTGSRWNSADLDVTLAEGSAVEITVAASRSIGEIAQIDAIFADQTRSPSDRFTDALARIPWREKETIVYAGQQGEPAKEKLRYLLDGRTETHVWLRIRCRSLTGRVPARLSAMRIFYPERSYLEFLPAIYRENEAPARELRRFLAPVEALFDEIDDEVEGLAGKIDPKTAPDDWRAFLLRWLGFTAVETLDAETSAALLRAAPDLLSRRGTLQALQQVLDILTHDHALIEDSSALPRPWILPPGAGHTSNGPKLGVDTLVVTGDHAPCALALICSSARRG